MMVIIPDMVARVQRSFLKTENYEKLLRTNAAYERLGGLSRVPIDERSASNNDHSDLIGKREAKENELVKTVVS